MNKQRKGEWLINHILNDNFPNVSFEAGVREGLLNNALQIKNKIWNMPNSEFDSIMEKYE